MTQLDNAAPAYEVTRRDGRIIAACVCGDGLDVPDKGMGRAVVGTWRTRHADCTPPERTPA